MHFSPASDTAIKQRYSHTTLEQKIQNKIALQRELGWAPEPKRPLLCLPAGMNEELGGALFQAMLPGILTQPIEILVLGRGSKAFGSLFTTLAKEQRHRMHIVPVEEEAQRKMYAAADMALFTADPAKLPELQHCLEYGIVPVAPVTRVLEDYNPVQEAGCAFLYEQPTTWHCFAALVRALETYKFPFDWRTIQRHAMQTGHNHP